MLMLSVVCCSFNLPYLSVAPSLATFPVSGPAAVDTDSESAHPSLSANVMSHVMSQMIAQMAAGQIVSCSM